MQEFALFVKFEYVIVYKFLIDIKLNVNMNIREQIVNELHKTARRNYSRITIVTKGVHDLWQADLVEMCSGNLRSLSKINCGYKYLLTVVDMFSKFAWAQPIKNKTGKDVVQAFSKIIKQAGKSPKFLQTDRGREF